MDAETVSGASDMFCSHQQNRHRHIRAVIEILMRRQDDDDEERKRKSCK